MQLNHFGTQHSLQFTQLKATPVAQQNQIRITGYSKLQLKLLNAMQLYTINPAYSAQWSSMQLNATHATECNSCSSPRFAALHNLRNLKRLTQRVRAHTRHSVIHISGLASPVSKEWEQQGLQDCSQPLVCHDQSCLMKQIIVGIDKYYGFSLLLPGWSGFQAEHIHPAWQRRI